MSKFKVGDLVYAIGYEHKDWQYEVVMTGLVRAMSNDEGILVKCTKKPEGSIVDVGFSSIVSPNSIALRPKIHKVTVITYTHPGAASPRSITEYTEAEFRKYHAHLTVLNVTEIEVEFSE